jgi:hypothetical protein
MESKENRLLQRVVTFLNREEVDYLDKIGKDALFSTGFKLPRTRIIQTLVDLLKKIKVDGRDIRSGEDLENKLLAALRRLDTFPVKEVNKV